MRTDQMEQWMENDTLEADAVNLGLARQHDTGELTGIVVMLTINRPNGEPGLQMSGVVTSLDEFVEAVNRCARVVKGEEAAPEAETG